MEMQVQDLSTSSQLELTFGTSNAYSEEFYNDGQNSKTWGFTGFSVVVPSGWDANRVMGLEVSVDNGLTWYKYYVDNTRVTIPTLQAGSHLAPAAVVGAGAYPRIRLVSLNSTTLADAAQADAVTVTVVLWR